MTIRVLLVDDERLARRRVREILQGDRDIEVVGEPANGSEAVNAVRETNPDLMFLDVQMPGASGFDVEPVADGELALNAARAFAPDLVIMDIQLPGVSGVDLIAAMRRDAMLGRTPVLAVTAYAGKGDEDRIRDAGATGSRWLAAPLVLLLRRRRR